MTVANESFEKSYTTQGLVNENFPTTFEFFDAIDLFFYIDGSLQTLGTNYTVTGGGGTTGTVIFVGTPTANVVALIVRRNPTTQDADYKENDGFPAEVHEDAMDGQSMAGQSSLRLDSDDPRDFNAGEGASSQTTRKIINVKDGTNAQDVTTKAQLDAATLTTTDLPAPTAPDDEKFLKVTSVGPPAVFAYDDPRVDIVVPVGGDAGKFLKATGAGTTAFETLPAASAATFPQNFIINGDFQVSQRAGTGGTHQLGSLHPNNDGLYTLDRFILLSEVNDAVEVLHETSLANLPDGARNGIRLTVTGTNPLQKFGIFTIIESHLARRLFRDGVSSKVSLRFKHKRSSAAAFNIKVGILPWTDTGNIDNTTRDPVSAWNAAGVDPTIGGSWNTYENPPEVDIAVGTSYAETIVQDIALDVANTVNVGLFIWVDNKDLVAGDSLFLADIQLEIGTVSNPFIVVDPASQLLECQRYTQTIRSTVIGRPIANGRASTDVSARLTMPFTTRMRVEPAITFSAAADFRISHQAVVDTVDAFGASAILDDRARLVATIAAGNFTPGDALSLDFLTATGVITLDAEL